MEQSQIPQRRELHHTREYLRDNQLVTGSLSNSAAGNKFYIEKLL